MRILINSPASTNHSFVYSGYVKYRKKLLRAGIEIYELNKKLSKAEKKNSSTLSQTGLHAKSFFFDFNKIFIGSLSLDPIAIYNNTEMGIIIDQSEIAGRMVELFDENIDTIAFRVKLVKKENGNEHLQWTGYENGKKNNLYKRALHRILGALWNRYFTHVAN